MDIVLKTFIDNQIDPQYSKFLKLLTERKYFDMAENLSTFWTRERIAREKFNSRKTHNHFDTSPPKIYSKREVNNENPQSALHSALIQKIWTIVPQYYNYFRSGQALTDIFSKIMMWALNFLFRMYLKSASGQSLSSGNWW